MVKTKKQNDRRSDNEIARQNWSRYQYCRQAGHDSYVKDAIRNEDFYLGGGLQWSEADRADMNAKGRMMAEINHVLPAVQTATGMQLHRGRPSTYQVDGYLGRHRAF